MDSLIQRFSGLVKGVISGFDRIVFKGRILPLLRAEGAESFCERRRILNKDYRDWMEARSAALVRSVEQYALRETGQPVVHLNSYRIDKEKTARERQRERGIARGLIGVWSCQESAFSYKSQFCPGSPRPRLRRYPTRCNHLYLYFDHAEFGFMNIRVQTWFPYDLQICMNGREWLRRALEREGLHFTMSGNKLLEVEDFARARELLVAPLAWSWASLLDGFLPTAFPTLRETLGPHLSYYWTCWQSEWATDLIFRTAADLDGFSDALIRHAFMTGTATRVLRYLGRPVTQAGGPRADFHGDVHSQLLEFHDGVRVRHWLDQNSAKAYTELNNLRLEATVNDPTVFYVHRHARRESPQAPKQLRPLRKGVADLPLRARVSQEINDRLATQLATFDNDTPLGDVLAPVTRARVHDGRRLRALDPTGKDRELLKAIADPKFTVSGLTNAELRDQLKGTAWAGARTEAQLSARITRHLRLLRDHGLIRKVPHRRRYHLTASGCQLTTAVLASLQASTRRLMELAA